MALYGKLEKAKTDRFFNLGKTNGGFFISAYSETESENINKERTLNLRQMISRKKLSFVPIFCGDKNGENIDMWKTCFFVVNRKKAVMDDGAFLSYDELLNFGIELCNLFDIEDFDFLCNGEVKTFSKKGEILGLYCPGVLFTELVNRVYRNDNPMENDSIYYIRTFATLSGKMSHGPMGELFFWHEELPSCKEFQFHHGEL